MNKRIFRHMSLLILLTVLFFALFWAVAFSGLLGDQIEGGLKNLRVSVIDPTGRVMFDNVADPATMENHLDRPEVAQALESGTGESERFSETLDEVTYYYGMRLESGNVLRLALTGDNLVGLLYRFAPVILLCLVLAAGFAFVIARRLTRRITAPINSLNLDAPELGEYEELLPLLKKVETLNQEVAEQMAEIENRTATITAITGNMKEGLLLLDTGGKILLANESILKILHEREALGKNMIEVCRDPAFLEGARECLAGQKTERALYLGERVYSVLFNPVLDKGSLNGAAVLFIDRTERFAAERQRKEFSANVSHELKTPLTTIAALSEMIADGRVKDADVRPFSEKIHRQSRRLIDIIEDIIRLSAFDEGHVPKNFTRFNLYEMAAGVLAILRERAAERDVTLTLSGDAGLYATANMRMMDELLYNLVDNAIKYNRPGGSVAVELADAGEHLRIRVADTGIGIPKEHLGRIFERFYRVEKSRSKKTGGTGLGLSIVKHTAEFHGGRVFVESKEGEGTVFTCMIRKDLPQNTI